MARIKRGVTAHKRKKKVLKMAKGYYGAKSKQFRSANQSVIKSMAYAYSGRKQKKRDYRRLWIVRINAAARLNDMTYSTFINGLKIAGIDINRKMLSELAIADMDAFAELIKASKKALEKGPAKKSSGKAAASAKVETAEKVSEKKPAAKAPAKKTATTAAKTTTAKKTASTAAKSTTAKKTASTAAKSTTAKKTASTAAKSTTAKKTASTAAKSTAAKKATSTAAKAPAKKASTEKKEAEEK